MPYSTVRHSSPDLPSEDEDIDCPSPVFSDDDDEQPTYPTSNARPRHVSHSRDVRHDDDDDVSDDEHYPRSPPPPSAYPRGTAHPSLAHYSSSASSTSTSMPRHVLPPIHAPSFSRSNAYTHNYPPASSISSSSSTHSRSSSSTPPSHTPFQPLIVPSTPNRNSPSQNPSSIPAQSCTKLRHFNIDPQLVVLPPPGVSCPWSSKPSCQRTDWRPAMWERHIQTHLPDALKEYWECPNCRRAFNRKCAFVSHLRKTKTDCLLKANLDGVREDEWKAKWFHEPMPLR
ncbi:hypothetical protein SISNIDRAFT_550709 [Sistotremastrum niveocremeum HHB9708]|uniref:C2H2-type domain-containing protein n=1 Tax=Sistotremastrum niveocremeum HHB9708 TaxID=1314777 RepID=A0A164SZ30_9AGAM|nr:hypothetical protein SISNIDRAFT_550709 [Sistotremastrum niveocremeum HHB9708]